MPSHFLNDLRQYNTEDRPLPNKFLSIQAVPQSGYRASFHKGGSPVTAPGDGPTPVSAGPGGAFAGFGVNGGVLSGTAGGGGGGGGGWRSKRSGAGGS